MFETLYLREARVSKPFPVWLRITWIAAAPMGFALSARILWEKTLLTAERGEQMIGFSLMHVHPGFFFSGLLCVLTLLAWLLSAAVYLAFARLMVGITDYAMLAGSTFVLFAALLPDNFGLRLR